MYAGHPAITKSLTCLRLLHFYWLQLTNTLKHLICWFYRFCFIQVVTGPMGILPRWLARSLSDSITQSLNHSISQSLIIVTSSYYSVSCWFSHHQPHHNHHHHIHCQPHQDTWILQQNTKYRKNVQLLSFVNQPGLK